MEYRLQKNCENIDWQEASNLLQEAGLASHPADLVKKAFQNSYSVVFVFYSDLLIGVGRVISDGAYEAAMYDIAVLPAYQGKKIGKMIVEELHKTLSGIDVILFARPGKELFYRKLGYSKLLTGMGKFNNENRMREKGFIE